MRETGRGAQSTGARAGGGRYSAALVAASAVIGALLVAVLPASGAGAAPAPTPPAPTNLTVNYTAHPLGIQSSPRFAWDSRATRQSAYEIRVATSSDFRGGAVWDSGRTASPNDLQVAYGGPPPKSHTRYFWQVRVWNGAGQASGWSGASWWETGLLSLSDWGAARWIGGRQPQDHDWTDMTETVNFRITNAATGAGFLFHALPVGKTWGEYYDWQLKATGPVVQLVESTSHYAGNTGVPGGSPAVNWGVNYYDPQSETNPTATGTRSVSITTLSGAALGDVTAANLMTADHQIKIGVSGNTVTTWLDGTQVDQRTLSGDELRPDGTVGFLAGSAATVRNVAVQAPGQPAFSTDFHGASNPFEAGAPIFTAPNGDPANDGLPVSLAGNLPLSPVGVTGKDVMLPIANPAPLLRDEFATAPKPIASARLYVAAGGYPKLTINGQSVTVDGRPPAADGSNVPHLVPDQTNYDKTVLYDTFDVTALMHAGSRNVLGAELGRGWYGLTVPDEWYWQMADFHGVPRMLAKLAITYADGTTQTVVSDPATWRTQDGPTTFDSAYTGEKYDARIAQAIGDWTSPGYDASSWRPATQLNPPGSCTGPNPAACHGFIPASPPTPAGFVPATLKAQENEPVLVNQVRHPIAIYETAPGSKVYIFDMGQIATGWVHLHLNGVAPGKAGLTIRMRQDEMQNGTGTAALPYSLTEGNGFVDGDSQTDYYTLSGAPTQDWEASFRYGGFRYVEVRGLYDVLGRAPDLKTDSGLVTAEVARSGFASTGSFGSSNALLNRIWQNVRWAEQNNSVAKETDTPNREKNGWTGDAQAGSESEMLDFDMSRFFTKWLRDFPDSMISTGEMPEIVPAAKGGYGYDQTPGWNFTYGPTPAWDAALFVIPWEEYQYYGNAELLRELYPTQKRFMKYYATRFTAANHYTYTSSLGEYGAFKTEVADPDTPVINQQYYFYFADYMAKVAAMLGDTAGAATYRRLANDVLASFVAKYWSSTTGAFTGVDTSDQNANAVAGANVESVNAMALAFGMVPGATPAERAANQASVAAAIANDLTANGDHIQAGVYGLHYLFNALDQYGYTNLAYSVATQTTPPSYGDQIAQGATSLWELWETTTEGEFSQDHHYFSSIGTWFYQGLAGIKPAAPGYRAVQVIPHVPSNSATSSVPASVADELTGTSSTLDHVSGSIRTPRGLVSSDWTRHSDGRIGLRVCIPDNTPAQVWVPTVGGPVAAPSGATFLRDDSQGANQYAVYSVSSGCYAFNGGSSG